MTTIKIQSIDKEVTLLPLTHGIQKQIQAKIMEGVTVRTDITGKTEATDIPVLNTIHAKELSVKLRFGLSDSEMDSILDEEYDTLVEALLDDEVKKKKK